MENLIPALGYRRRYPPRGCGILYQLKTLLIVVAIFCVLAAGASFVGRVYNLAIAAENTLQAVFQTQQATIKYLDANNGKWPASWDHLEVIEPAYDFEWVATQIDFDFDADPVVLAKQRPDEFMAIRQKTGYYNIEPELKKIIDTLGKYH